MADHIGGGVDRNLQITGLELILLRQGTDGLEGVDRQQIGLADIQDRGQRMNAPVDPLAHGCADLLPKVLIQLGDKAVGFDDRQIDRGLHRAEHRMVPVQLGVDLDDIAIRQTAYGLQHIGEFSAVETRENIDHHALLLRGIGGGIAHADRAVGSQHIQRFDHLLGVQILLCADLIVSGRLDEGMELFGKESHLTDHDIPDKTITNIEQDGQDNAHDRGVERGTDTLEQSFDTVHCRLG